MADTKAFPVFAFTEDRVQVQQLRSFMKERGANIEEEGPDDIGQNLLDVAANCAIIGEMESDKEVEMILSSISSLFVAISPAEATLVVSEFCRQLSSEKFQGTGWTSNAGAAIRILSNLFYGFNRLPAVQHAVYVALVILCGRARLIADLDTSMETVNGYFKSWGLNKEQQRSLLRLIHKALIIGQRADQAAKTMIALLSTYTEADAASALEDARECVRTAIVDPKSFCFDHLLRLSAVKLLEKNDPEMNEMLKLFAEGTLKEYRAFVSKNPSFVEQKLRVEESILVKKMRLLTLMSMAEEKQVITLSELSKEIDIAEGEQLEEFIIHAISVSAINGKINGVTKELHVSSTQHRCFGRPQWETLQKRLITLITNLQASHDNIKNVNIGEEMV